MDHDRHTLSISQEQYVETILKRHGMSDCRPVSTPMEANFKLDKLAEAEIDPKPYQSALGALMYAMLGSRPDIAFAVGTLSKHASTPGTEHWNALMRVFRYLRGTSGLRLTYGKDLKPLCEHGLTVVGYSDADWAGDRNDRRSTSAYVFKLGGGAISWCSRKQQSIAQSSTEAEYVALALAAKEGLWLSTLLSDLDSPVFHALSSRLQVPLILVDNQSAMALAKNSSFHDRTKHIAVRHHFIRDELERGTLTVEYVPTGDQVADVLTKSLAREKHTYFTNLLGLY
ncbi:hypothetical protein BN946_scf184818.g1 [Trametes cinnabarina]|uniref:Reverse transcriptase Ty1/copia-type domain-containing protein n=1 Tax=Pycnoporus cinnabarinus TaxID=5643 RepID=A0A060SU91_PYCCI|nr:hypothetical protein BN946_scf184818.g1 [Trametes cinnabarina]